MPIYEYRCTACGAELEKLQKISDQPLLECPECGRDALVKLVSASSFRLKGSGWYETDFKTGKKKNGAGEADTAAGSDSAAQAGGDVAAESGKTEGNGGNSAGNEEGGKPAAQDSDTVSKKQAGHKGAKSGASQGAGKPRGKGRKPTA